MTDMTSAAVRLADPAMLAEVGAGLARPQKELPPKYFYDRRGSELFEQITRLPEYYPTRTERALLAEWMPALVPALGPRALVELGAGSGEKTRLILDELAREPGAAYVPNDVSATFLHETAERLRREYPGLRVAPLVADIAAELRLPPGLPGPVLFAFLGSTIGNFAPPDAAQLLARVGRLMGRSDHLLLGVDLRKDPRRIEAAYNDTRGVTAEFNRNMLNVLNHELGADFDPLAFEHVTFYSAARHRIEMHLMSLHRQTVTIPGIGAVGFEAGESLRTEISCKYDRASVAALLDASGLSLAAWRVDPECLFALALARRVP
jgi:L-histidine N-alpha-methyltransferase